MIFIFRKERERYQRFKIRPVCGLGKLRREGLHLAERIGKGENSRRHPAGQGVRLHRPLQRPEGSASFQYLHGGAQSALRHQPEEQRGHSAGDRRAGSGFHQSVDRQLLYRVRRQRLYAAGGAAEKHGQVCAGHQPQRGRQHHFYQRLQRISVSGKRGPSHPQGNGQEKSLGGR